MNNTEIIKKSIIAARALIRADRSKYPAGFLSSDAAIDVLAETIAFDLGVQAIKDDPKFGTIRLCLGWLCAMDPNGIWSEYVADPENSCAEYGELVLSELQATIAEMKADS